MNKYSRKASGCLSGPQNPGTQFCQAPNCKFCVICIPDGAYASTLFACIIKLVSTFFIIGIPRILLLITWNLSLLRKLSWRSIHFVIANKDIAKPRSAQSISSNRQNTFFLRSKREMMMTLLNFVVSLGDKTQNTVHKTKHDHLPQSALATGSE